MYVVKKIHNPACIQDFSANIQRNATFHVDLRRCMDAISLNNGSRVFSGHVEVGFHPLVVSSNDRLFSVKCIDNAYAISHRASKHQEGCIVDSELIGEIVYNNFMPKIFARARVFKFMNDEKHRIECQVQMCSSEGVCKDRIFPPKCAITKEEILNRYSSNTKIDVIDNTFMTGTINNRYEHQIKVTSEWITVHNNQYTNIELLQERFYLSAVIDDKMEEPKVRTTPRHFLMGISYRSPNSTEFRRNELNDNDFSSIDNVGSPTAFQPQNPTIGSGEIDNIELSTTTSPSPNPTVSETEDFVTFPSTVLESDSTQTTVLEEMTQTQTLMTTSIKRVESQSTDSSIPSSTTTQTSMGLTTKSTSPPRSHREPVICLLPWLSTPTSPQTAFKIKGDKFSNPRDWRLDDRTINDTDMLPERQVACSNATIIARRMIPEAFLGTHFVEAKEEHLDDFLSVRGVPWLVRKMISGKMRKGQFLMNRNPDGTYTYYKCNVYGYHVVRGTDYQLEYDKEKLKVQRRTRAYKSSSSSELQITISVEGDKVKEAHLNLERDIGEDVFYYFFRDGILISECEASNNGKKATWTREFVKKT
ncbi:unnamed protein product [Haemonchus placei]|uniref:ZP domain-containing protein n=1 Tax=Haemonchus placei TaxID=6290 RepID=A0A158QNG5_HAEPC|nr:unnamed protein product [Haemonchus placei]